MTARRTLRHEMSGNGCAPTHAVQLTLLVRAYCHLCDDMRAALQPLAGRHQAAIVEIDVDADPSLEAAFGERVPVLLLGTTAQGVEICHYALDAAALQTALTRASRSPPLP